MGRITDASFSLLDVSQLEIPPTLSREGGSPQKMLRYLVRSTSSEALPHLEATKRKLRLALGQIASDFSQLVSLGCSTTRGFLLEVPDDPRTEDAIVNFLGQLDIMLWGRLAK